MICNSKYLYKIELVTASDVTEFNRIATKCPGSVVLVNGMHGKKRLNAKSYLGVHLARVTWNEVYVENYKGIIEYGKCCIKIQTKVCRVTFSGKNLEIVYYTNVDMKITGEIESICYS